MAIRARVTVQGLDDLRRKLRQLDQAEIKKLAQTPVEAAASIIATEARAGAPRDPGRKEGAQILAESMTVVPGDDVKGKGRRKAGINRKRAQALAGPTDFTGLFIELGWVHAGNQRHIPARPFLRPAFEAKKDQAQSLAVNAIKVAIEQKASRL